MRYDITTAELVPRGRGRVPIAHTLRVHRTVPRRASRGSASSRRTSVGEGSGSQRHDSAPEVAPPTRNTVRPGRRRCRVMRCTAATAEHKRPHRLRIARRSAHNRVQVWWRVSWSPELLRTGRCHGQGAELRRRTTVDPECRRPAGTTPAGDDAAQLQGRLLIVLGAVYPAGRRGAWLLPKTHARVARVSPSRSDATGESIVDRPQRRTHSTPLCGKVDAGIQPRQPRHSSPAITGWRVERGRS
jgi:hypothetical protein